MNKFKVGDEVVSTIHSFSLTKGSVYKVIHIYNGGEVVLKGRLNRKYSTDCFEIYKENKDMKKFKVGDKVVRVSETYGKAIKGEVYEVSGVSDNEWAGSCGINLKGHEGVSGKFNYESSCFELYVDGILSPLEAAEALLKGEELEVIISKSEEWQPLGKHQNSVSVKNLKRWKFRRKPKTVVINGVEVVAPVDAKSLGYPDKVYGINLSRKSIYDTTGHTNKGLFWVTEEDAQKALDAMLIPFKH